MHKTGDLRLFYSRCLNVDDSHISICMAYRDQSRFPLRQQIFFANTKKLLYRTPQASFLLYWRKLPQRQFVAAIVVTASIYIFSN